MSLINDALKRAKQAQANQSPPPATGIPTPPPPARPPPRPTSGVGLLLLAAALLGGGAVALIYLGTFSGPEAERELFSMPHKTAGEPAGARGVSAQSRPATPPARTTPEAVAAPEPPPAAGTSAPVSPPPSAVLVESAPVPAVAAATNPPAVPVEAPPAPPPLPKLQGIFYRPDRPSALLNGRTVFVGGRSGEFLVLAITQTSVTVTRAGQTNVLELPE